LEKVVKVAILMLLLISILFLPIGHVRADEPQNVSVSWIVDSQSYKRALVSVVLGDAVYEFLFDINIARSGSETYFNISFTSENGQKAWVLCRLADVLGGAPYTRYCQTVEAFRLDIPSWAVKVLTAILIGALVTVVAYLVYLVLTQLVAGGLLQFLTTTAVGQFAWASLPWVLLTLFQERNPDGSVTLYFPYSPTDYISDLIGKGSYAITTNRSWWLVQRKGWWIFTYFVASWWGPVVPPEDWCKTPPIIPIPAPIRYNVSASFLWWPVKPFAGENITLFSSSFAPNGSI